MSFLDVLKSFGRLFYVVSPNGTSFETYMEVPDYIEGAIPDLFFLFFLEVCVSRALGKSCVRFNSSIAALSQGLLVETIRFALPGGQFAVYVYLYSNWRLVELPWNSLSTWWVCFFLVDFVYYWLHRAAHEINILWATHQVHHSAEDYNIAINTRQSVLQAFTIWMFYLPLALFIPPSIYIVHAQFSYIYQFWIHTELIRSFGPLEYILNTPSHHRVHHGANKMCIDKNFGGTLIIWDRLFGTFQSETGEIIYGITTPVHSFGLLRIQFDHCILMWRAFKAYKGWKNKLSVIFKGPGWTPGKSWHGDLDNILQIKAPVQKYDPQLPRLIKAYLLLHFYLLLQMYGGIKNNYLVMPDAVLYGTLIYMVFTLTCIGMLLDKRVESPRMELIRCLLYFAVDYYFLSYTRFSLTVLQARWVSEIIVRATFGASVLLWATDCFLSKMIDTKEVLNDGWWKNLYIWMTPIPKR